MAYRLAFPFAWRVGLTVWHRTAILLRRTTPMVAIGAVFAASLAAEQGPAVPLPYDRTHPVIYDNDGTVESGYTDEYVMALASARMIQLRGMVTTCSYAEEKRNPPFSALPDAKIVRERQELIEKARRSGLRSIPDATAGPTVSLQSRRPVSGRIEDTKPLGSPGSWLIVKEARKATPEKPLVIVMGGQVTAAADAYLLDNSIADKMVLAWLAGNQRSDGTVDSSEYNIGVDAWASYIALERLRVVLFPFRIDGADQNHFAPHMPKARFGELPDTELRQCMMENRYWRGTYFSVAEYDFDTNPAIPLTRPDYVLETQRFRFSHWYPASWNTSVQLLHLKPDPNGRILVVWRASGTVATKEWWSRMKDPTAWGTSVGQVPFGATLGGPPWHVPGTIQAEDFDHGGTGRAYKDNTGFMEGDRVNPIRFLELADIYASGTAKGGYKVGSTEAGEWLEYTINVASAGTFMLEVRVASKGAGGTFHVEFGGVDKSGSMTIPDTGGWDSWQTLSRANVTLNAGPQVMRLVMHSNGVTGAVGDFDYVRLTSTAAPDQ